MARTCQYWYSIMTAFASKCVLIWHSNYLQGTKYILQYLACEGTSMKYAYLNYHWLQNPYVSTPYIV